MFKVWDLYHAFRFRPPLINKDHLIFLAFISLFVFAALSRRIKEKQKKSRRAGLGIQIFIFVPPQRKRRNADGIIVTSA